MRGSGYWGWGCLGEADGRAMFLRTHSSTAGMFKWSAVCH